MRQFFKYSTFAFFTDSRVGSPTLWLVRDDQLKRRRIKRGRGRGRGGRRRRLVARPSGQPSVDAVPCFCLSSPEPRSKTGQNWVIRRRRSVSDASGWAFAANLYTLRSFAFGGETNNGKKIDPRHFGRLLGSSFSFPSISLLNGSSVDFQWIAIDPAEKTDF